MDRGRQLESIFLKRRGSTSDRSNMPKRQLITPAGGANALSSARLNVSVNVVCDNRRGGFLPVTDDQHIIFEMGREKHRKLPTLMEISSPCDRQSDGR